MYTPLGECLLSWAAWERCVLCLAMEMFGFVAKSSHAGLVKQLRAWSMWIMCECCSLCYVPMGWLMCQPLWPVAVLCLYCNQRAGMALALLYFNNSYQERKHSLLWILFNSAQQLKISTFNYLGEWTVWLESWGKFYDLRIKCCKEPYVCNWSLKL